MNFLVSKELYPSLRRNLAQAWQDVLTQKDHNYFANWHKFKGICCYVDDEKLNQVVYQLTEKARLNKPLTRIELKDLDQKVKAILDSLK